MNRLHHLATSAVAALTLATMWLPNVNAITIEWVTVGDPGNTADDTTYGAVAEPYRIMTYEFTNQQYTDFLNAVAQTDDYFLYNERMDSDARGGIVRSGVSGSYSYSLKANMGDKPVNYVSWFDAARVANWLMNGATGTSSTETGSYTLNGATSGTAPAINPNATFALPTQDQWYKAAYYMGGSTNAGYWEYPTQSDAGPTPVTADPAGIGSAGGTGNFANYRNQADWNGRDGNVTTVGTNGGATAYGAFDMGGNVWEWFGAEAGSTQFQFRGGGWGSSGVFSLSSAATLNGDDGSTEFNAGGFRLSSPVPVPEPSTVVMGVCGLLCIAGRVSRNRTGKGKR